MDRTSAINPMSGIAGWLIVAASFLLIGVFGYASVSGNRCGSTIARARLIIMVLAAVVSAFALNVIAAQLFMATEIGIHREFGGIREDQMQPDSPNLVAGLIMFGWVFFLAGSLVARSIKGDKPNRKSDQG